jgi:hypothetical protein
MDDATPARTLVSWQRFVDEQPEMAQAVKARFDFTKHHVLATLRKDGSPRVSGTEVIFSGDDLLIGSMWRSVKALDLLRDGRFAMHSNPGDGSMEGGDAKVFGVAVEVVGERHAEVARQLTEEGGSDGGSEGADDEPFHLFRLDLSQVVHSSIHPDGDRMVILSWRPGKPLFTVER